MGLYERIMRGEKVRVKSEFRKEPFTVRRLLMMGPDHYVTESSEWARYAKVGGLVINGRLRHRMGREEMQAWCERMQEVVDDAPSTAL